MRALLAAALVVVPLARPAGAVGHPVNAQGFVTDGTPQNDDGHCVGTTAQRVACLLARRPQCRHTGAMSRAEATACFAPEINVYPWPHQQMFDALYCESRGEEGARNGRYLGLLQSDHGTGDALHDFEDAYNDKWRGQGASAWAATYGRWCG